MKVPGVGSSVCMAGRGPLSPHPASAQGPRTKGPGAREGYPRSVCPKAHPILAV